MEIVIGGGECDHSGVSLPSSPPFLRQGKKFRQLKGSTFLLLPPPPSGLQIPQRPHKQRRPLLEFGENTGSPLGGGSEKATELFGFCGGEDRKQYNQFLKAKETLPQRSRFGSSIVSTLGWARARVGGGRSER
uniref:Uncharacterized protein n=1 Tax=Sphaerodactylus townsendi TaxID=933632 RepID=A0ACB8F0S6_9SAUR